jgi:hypothetical protein
MHVRDCHHPQGIEPIHETEGLLYLARSNVAGHHGLLDPIPAIGRIDLEQLIEHFLTPRLAVSLGPEHPQLLPLVCGTTAAGATHLMHATNGGRDPPLTEQPFDRSGDPFQQE